MQGILTGSAQPVNPVVAAEISRQLRVLVSKFRRHRFRVDVRDIEQEAWVQALVALPGYDPGCDGADGYFYRVGLRAAAPYVNRNLSLVSLSRAAARAGVGCQFQGQAAPGALELLACEEDSSRRGRAREEGCRRRVRLMRAYLSATRDLPQLARDVGDDLLGMNGPAVTPERCAARRGISLDMVAALRRLVRGELEASMNYSIAHREVVLAELEADE